MSTFDISTLAVQDFCIEAYTSVTSKYKSVTRKRTDKIVYEILEKCISDKIKKSGDSEEKVKQEWIKIRESESCKELAKKITDLVLEIRFLLIDFHSIEEPDTPLSENGDNG